MKLSCNSVLKLVKIGVITFKDVERNIFSLSETVYTSETVDLFFKRSVYDKTDDFLKYRIYKGHNISVITLGREENGKHGTCVIDPLLSQCQQRYSLRYVNKTYISFRLSNLTLLDSGLYILQAFFDKMVYNPEYAEIYLTVQGNQCQSSFFFWAGINGHHGPGGVLASWLVRSPPDRTVRVRALAEDTEL